MSRNIHFAEGEFYHLFNRGNDKRVIFRDKADKTRFQKLLFLCNSAKPLHLSVLKSERNGTSIFEMERGGKLIDIGAYCILGNHFHLLVRECVDGGISQFMHKLATAYSMYFNIRNNRTGSLFEGKFRARHALDDAYLRYLFAYLHLNPVKHIEPNWYDTGIKNYKKTWDYLLNYGFSSLPDYLGYERPECVILCKESFPKYFTNNRDTFKEINYWLRFKPVDCDDSKFQG